MPDRARVAVGSRIREHRERRELSQSELARLVGRTQTAISYWESGRRSPDVDDLIALAEALAVDPGELIAGARARRSPAVVLRAAVERLDRKPLADAVDRFISVVEERPIPTAEITVSRREPISAALELISSAGIRKPPVPVEGIAARCGVRVVGFPFGDDANAISGLFLDLDTGPAIGFNSDQRVRGRQRFTIAHELGHYLLRHHDNFHLDLNSAIDHGETLNYDWRDERAANDFAAELLMPATLVRHAAGPNITVTRLAETFEVSKEAMGIRLINLELR